MRWAGDHTLRVSGAFRTKSLGGDGLQTAFHLLKRLFPEGSPPQPLPDTTHKCPTGTPACTKAVLCRRNLNPGAVIPGMEQKDSILILWSTYSRKKKLAKCEDMAQQPPYVLLVIIQEVKKRYTF